MRASAGSSGKSAADATDYLAKTTCRWFFEVPDGGLTGLSFRAPVWDVEASGTLTSTTDAVEIYQQGDDGAPSGDAVATLKGGDDPMDWDFDFSATSGKFVAVFASDLNNPVPKKGFDLVYAGKYGSATAGANGGFCPTALGPLVVCFGDASVDIPLLDRHVAMRRERIKAWMAYAERVPALWPTPGSVLRFFKPSASEAKKGE